MPQMKPMNWLCIFFWVFMIVNFLTLFSYFDYGFLSTNFKSHMQSDKKFLSLEW